MSEAASKVAKNGERGSKYANSISRTTSETLRVTDVDVGSSSQIPASQRQKKSSFQITSVVTATRMSNDGGEDSADDLDESHTEDISDVVDNSRVTDLENETPSYSEDTFSKDDVFFNPSSTSFGTAPVIPTSSQYGLAIVSANDPNSINQSNANEININDSSNVINITNVKNAENELGRETTHVTRNERFKVVKIESTEPFKRGRWQCMDYLDHTMLHHHPQQTVINIKNEVSDAQNPLVQNSYPGQEGVNDTHEEVENFNNPSHATNMQNSLQNSVSPGQSVHNLQISIPKANPTNTIPNQNINQQQIIQSQAQSMSHTTVPMQQNVQQTQSLPHQQMQQVISQANYQQQNSTQPQNMQSQSQQHQIQNMPSQINQTQQIPQPQQMSQPQQHPQMSQPQQQQPQPPQQQQHLQLQQIQQQMMQGNSMPQAPINHNLQQYYPAGNQTSILANQNQMMQNQQVVQGGPAMLGQQGHMPQANINHVTQAAQIHQGQNMMNMGQQIGHPIQQYQNQALPVQMQQQLQQNYNQQLVQNQMQQVPAQNPSMGGYVMPTNAIQNQQISQTSQILQNQQMQQQNPSQAIQQTTSMGSQMSQLMQQSGQIIQGGQIIPQPQQTVLPGGPSNTTMQGQQMLQPQNYQNFTQTQQNVGMGTPSSNQPISYSSAGTASAAPNNQNQAITYSTAPVSVNPVNQAMGYNSQTGTSQTPVIPFTNTNLNQQITYSTPSVNMNQNVTQTGQSGGTGQQGMQNTQLAQSSIASATMQSQNVVSQMTNQINQTIPTSQTVMQSSGVLGQTQIQQSQMGQNQVIQNQTSNMLVSNQSVLTQPQQGQISQNVTQIGKIVSAAEITQNPSNLNLPMTVLEGSGLDSVRGNQPFAMDLPGSVALLESLVEVTASGEQFVPNDDER